MAWLPFVLQLQEASVEALLVCSKQAVVGCFLMSKSGGEGGVFHMAWSQEAFVCECAHKCLAVWQPAAVCTACWQAC